MVLIKSRNLPTRVARFQCYLLHWVQVEGRVRSPVCLSAFWFMLASSGSLLRVASTCTAQDGFWDVSQWRAAQPNTAVPPGMQTGRDKQCLNPVRFPMCPHFAAPAAWHPQGSCCWPRQTCLPGMPAPWHASRQSGRPHTPARPQPAQANAQRVHCKGRVSCKSCSRCTKPRRLVLHARTLRGGGGASPFRGLAGCSALAMPLRRPTIVSSR